MTALYFDTFIGCEDSFNNGFEMATEARTEESLVEKFFNLFR